MKKLGQKLSFLTKIMLVIGLLISNLSSLSVVFAYEGTEDVIVSLTEDVLEISYTEKLAEEVKAVDVRVYENYTYSGGLSEEEVVTRYSLTAEQLLAALEGELELEHKSIFATEEVVETNDAEVVATEEETVKNFELFDGTYSARVEIVDVTVYTEETVEEENTEEVVVTDGTVVEDETMATEDGATGVVASEIVLAEGTYEEEMTHESGLSVKLFDEAGEEISLVDGKYSVSAENSKVKVVAQILSGGLNPTDQFAYNGKQYIAAELVELEFSSETDFNGRLFGEYELPVEVLVSKLVVSDGSYEEVSYNDTVNVMYESYEWNAALLNMVAVQEGYGEAYLFYSDSKYGMLYVLTEIEENVETVEASETVVTRTMLDLYNMLNVALEEDETEEPTITYTLLKDGVDVLESYVPASEEDTLENYLSTIELDDNVVISLSNKGLTVTYKVVEAGDLDSDNVLTQNDVLELINQVVGENEVTDLSKSDLYGFDEKVNSLDVLYLNQVVKTKVWNAEIVETDALLDARLDVVANNEEGTIVSGDEFTVQYVLSLTDYEVNGVSGLFNFDKSMFELVSVSEYTDWIGNNYEGKFLYLGEESLTGPVEEETEVPEIDASETVTSDAGEETVVPGAETVLPDAETPENETTEEVAKEEYVVVTATFKALKATAEGSNNVITLKDIELYNSTVDGVQYYVLDKNTVSTEAITVVASEDNSLSYLEVAGIEITLEDGVYEYEITVSSDVTAVDLKYILGNVAANVTSEVYPEELVEGENTVVVTVTSESGVSQSYTITVVREEVEEETTTQVNYNDNYNNYEEDDNDDEQEVVTPEPDEDVDRDNDKDDEEESNLSRIVIIILILLVIAGLIYLIFKDEDDDETKKANKAVNKLKKEALESEVKKVSKTSSNKTNSKPNNNTKNKDSKNKKKER